MPPTRRTITAGESALGIGVTIVGVSASGTTATGSTTSASGSDSQIESTLTPAPTTLPAVSTCSGVS
jgi:hypothetical protein